MWQGSRRAGSIRAPPRCSGHEPASPVSPKLQPCHPPLRAAPCGALHARCACCVHSRLCVPPTCATVPAGFAAMRWTCWNTCGPALAACLARAGLRWLHALTAAARAASSSSSPPRPSACACGPTPTVRAARWQDRGSRGACRGQGCVCQAGGPALLTCCRAHAANRQTLQLSGDQWCASS